MPEQYFQEWLKLKYIIENTFGVQNCIYRIPSLAQQFKNPVPQQDIDWEIEVFFDAQHFVDLDDMNFAKREIEKFGFEVVDFTIVAEDDWQMYIRIDIRRKKEVEV